MKRINRRVGVAASAATLTIAGLALVGTPAQAAEAPRQAPRSCVANLVTKSNTCFGSFRDAIRNAGAALRDPGFEAELNATTVGASRSSSVADTVISIEYDGRDFTGPYQIWTASKGCPDSNIDDVDWEDSDMNGWVNVVSSYKSYANCWVKHFENPGFGGASVGPLPTRSYIGSAMDNRTSSIRWT
jgi:hypothetical protein